MGKGLNLSISHENEIFNFIDKINHIIFNIRYEV